MGNFRQFAAISHGFRIVGTEPSGPSVPKLNSGNGLSTCILIFCWYLPSELCEALHQAAYRDGLGRSLYMPSHKIGKFTGEMVGRLIIEISEWYMSILKWPELAFPCLLNHFIASSAHPLAGFLRCSLDSVAESCIILICFMMSTLNPIQHYSITSAS